MEVLSGAGITSILAKLCRFQLKWTEHVVRMTDERSLPQKIVYGELDSCKLACSGPIQREESFDLKLLAVLRAHRRNTSDCETHEPQTVSHIEEETF